MQTRCPACATIFRITPEQLKARHGQVRCGQCQRVFNALDTLLETALPPAGSPRPEEQARLATASDSADVGEEGGNVAEIAETALPDSDPPPVTGLDTPSEASTLAPEDTKTELSSASSDEPVVEPPPVESPSDDAIRWSFETLEDVTPAPVSRRWPWVLLSLLGLLALLLQLTFHFRGAIVELSEDARPVLQTFCAALDCEIPLSHRAELLAIEDSSLQPEPRQKDQMQLAVTLKNRAHFAQQYPHLELTLRDTYDQPMIRKIIAPGEYLPAGSAVSGGLGADQEINIHLALEPDKSLRGVPVGYLLYLFYP